MRSGRRGGEAADLHRASLRLGLQTGLLVVGVLVVVGSVLFLVYERAAGAAADQVLRATVGRIDTPAEAPPGIGIVIVSRHGEQVSANLPRGFPDQRAIAAVRRDGRTRQRDVDTEGRAYAVRTARVGNRIVQAVQDRQEREEERERILTALLIATGVGVLLAGLVATWLGRRAVQPLARTIAMQRRFVADASHELRTPLTLLSTRVQMLARRARREDAALTADVEGVVTDTKAMTEILDELLVAADSRPEADRVPVDLAALVRECAAAASAHAQHSGVDLGYRPPAGAVVVTGVPTSLRRAVMSLLDNALDHARSHVEVTVARHGHDAVVTVVDDGPGIPADQVPRMFERFTSSRAGSETPGRRHYGLGLALVADVAAAHSGSVGAGARADGAPGARLSLVLPIRRRGGHAPRHR
ncbi:MAG: sensor histidine kinase [Nocardioidaceae bacterium]